MMKKGMNGMHPSAKPETEQKLYPGTQPMPVSPQKAFPVTIQSSFPLSHRHYIPDLEMSVENHRKRSPRRNATAALTRNQTNATRMMVAPVAVPAQS